MEAAPLGMEIADELAFAERSAGYELLQATAMVGGERASTK
jgi:hypothetical protein